MCTGCEEISYSKSMVDVVLAFYKSNYSSDDILGEDEVYGEMQKIFNNDLVSRWYGSMSVEKFVGLLERMLEE